MYRFNVIPLFYAFTLCMVSHTSFANDALNMALFERLKKAQTVLVNTENKVANERAELSRKLHQLEQEVIELRQKTAAARRLSDEKTLSLSQLEQRLKQWRDQQIYQKNLVNRFVQKHKLSNVDHLTMNEQMHLISEFTLQLPQKLQPQWLQHNVIMPSGKTETAKVLSIGPMHWYWLASEQISGIAHKENGQFHSTLTLSSNENDTIEQLHKNNAGEIVFDPTMDRALARKQHNETPWQHLVKGGVWVVPIVVFAIIALIIALHKSIQLFRLPKVIHFLPENIHNLLYQAHSPLLTQLKGKQQTLLNIAKLEQSDSAKEDRLFIQLQQDKHSLERWLMVIGMTASVAPLLGLLGTVSGMIETFKMMTLFGSGDPEVVSGGIAQALITTELGLVVAIPALVLNAVLSKRSKSYYQELENFAIALCQPHEAAHSQIKEAAA